ncbi:hypothetical protein [Ruegeria meonggei]|uniref:hypothetical protein n=1 Tax=Ruegeria meonggei TaxID=1446476 RepID=UPI00366D2ED4
MATTMGGSSALSLGLFAISMAADGLLRGQTRIHFSNFRRSNQPRLFFIAIALVFAAGTGVIIAAIWAIFFKDKCVFPARCVSEPTG